MIKEHPSPQPRTTLSQRLPLIVLLIAVGVFDAIAITAARSLEINVIASILAISYTQTLLSAVWLANGFGDLRARLLIALLFLVAAIATTAIYIARAIGVFTYSDPSYADSLVSITVVFIFALLFHWALCLIVVVPMRFLGWQLIPQATANQPRPSDTQFGIRTILFWTAISAIVIAGIRAALRLADWRLNQFEWDHMLLSQTYSSFFVPLHLLITFGLLTGDKIWLRFFIVLACCGFLIWIEIEAVESGFSEADSGEIVVLNAYLVAFAAALVLAARNAGLRIARRLGRSPPSPVPSH